jgi:limonene 1,2-monooxygenase
METTEFEAWIGDHLSGGFEIIACPVLFIAAAAERTRHIRLRTGVVSLPYHNFPQIPQGDIIL